MSYEAALHPMAARRPTALPTSSDSGLRPWPPILPLSRVRASATPPSATSSATPSSAATPPRPSSGGRSCCTR